MRSITCGQLMFTFKCSCGSIEFYRPKWAKHLKSFFEGSFKCSDCKQKYDYASDEFVRYEVQTKLEI